MTAGSRALALVVGLAGFVVVVAALVRELALTAHAGLSWPIAGWWGGLTGGESRLGASIAAAVTGVLAVAFIVLAVRQLRSPRRGPDLVEFGDDAGRARLEVPALELALRRDIEKNVPGVRTRALTLSKSGGAWRVRLEAQMPADDLKGTRVRMAGILAQDLRRAGGLDLGGLDVVVTRLDLPRGTGGGQK